ncbi:armadillo-type protein [Roridomyces roridus]|uniref:Armadillo-type protein n=1 Tax=Roridomyces roridus TaxID=1738132 RepID=A0AAD7FQB0_9AGAR|nr:armadillo-type protein [Roridomyces roridus]
MARATAAPPPKKLSFRDKIVGKGLSTDALTKKLQLLQKELSELDQETIDVSSLGVVRKDLINVSILHHKDRGIKAFAACCLADILRLTAPDAPYTPAELRDIFQFFVQQVTTNLKSADAPYYTEYFHLLESLSTVKSVVLVCDLPNADELMTEIFKGMFQLARHNLPRKVEVFLADILIALIDECHTVPSDVLDLILAQFIDRNARQEQPAYRLAVQVCNSTADKLARHVSQYFTEIIVADRDDDQDLEEIRTAHELIKRLYHSCPDVLPSVIPQLEEELHAEELQLRLIVTEALGQMFADKGGGLELVKKYPSTWNAWLKRKNDKVPAVRLKFIEAAQALMTGPPEQSDAIEEAYLGKLLDPDDKVRAALCRVYGSLDYETALRHVSLQQLQALADRGLDRKPVVRSEALRALGKLYAVAYPEIENKDGAAITQFGWIPNKLLQMQRVSGDLRTTVEEVVAQYILPLPSLATTATSKGGEVDEVAWTDRLLTVMAYLDDENVVGNLLQMSTLQRARPTIFEHFVQSCVLNNGGVIDENEEAITNKLTAVTKHLSASLPDPVKALEDLKVFAKFNEQRLYKLLKTCMDPQTDLKALVKATNEFIKRVETESAGIAPTMTLVLRQASLRLINQSSVPTLLKRLGKPHRLTADNASKLIRYIAKHLPALFKSHIAELVKGLAAPDPILVEVSLQALSALVKWDEKVGPTDKRTIDRIKRLALEGTCRQAKFAARFLAFSKEKAVVCAEVVDTIADALGTTAPEILVAHVAVLGQFARFAPDAFEQRSDILMTFLVKKLLMVPTHKLDDEMDTEEEAEEWASDEEVSDNLRAKILAIKVCRFRCLAHVGADNAVEIATPVLKLLASLIDNGGSLVADSGEDPKVMSRMRLQAAVSLLHLASSAALAKTIAPKFLKLGLVVQDTCFDVRMTFLKKLCLLATRQKLPAQYNVIPFLTVHDPEEDVKNMAMSFVTGAMRRMTPEKRVQDLEMVFIRLLHLLAHHPDFGVDTKEELLDIAKYIWFYLEQVANADTVSLLFHLAGRGKTVYDAEPGESEKFWIACELAQELIKIWAKQHSLTVTTHPGKVKLPSDILRPMEKAEYTKQNRDTTYLSDEMLRWAAAVYDSAKEKKEKKERAPKRKAPAKANGNPTKRRRKRQSGRSDDDDDDEDAMDEDEPSSEPPAVVEDDEDESEADGEERLGRGQRTRAKRKQAKAALKKARQSSPLTESSEG